MYRVRTHSQNNACRFAWRRSCSGQSWYTKKERVEKREFSHHMMMSQAAREHCSLALLEKNTSHTPLHTPRPSSQFFIFALPESQQKQTLQHQAWSTQHFHCRELALFGHHHIYSDNSAFMIGTRSSENVLLVAGFGK